MGYDIANTRVFWDLEDFPVPDGVEDLSMFSWNVEKALDNEAFLGDVSIYAYGAGQTDEEAEGIGSARNFTFFRDNDKDARLNSMLMDMIFWASGQRPSLDDDHSEYTNLMVIAKDVPEKDSPFFKALKEFDELDYNILLVLPDEGLQLPTNARYTAQELLSIPILVWDWKTLFFGGPPIYRDDGSSQGPSICRDEGSSQGVKRHNTDSDSETSQQGVIRQKTDASVPLK